MAEQRATPDRVASYGRGGAGNIGKEDPAAHITPKDLVTPTLKSVHYTTGRGGSGNMAKNDPAHPELARAAQDVEAPTHRDADGPHHYGRGGAANIAKIEEEKRVARVAAGTEKSSGEKKRASGEPRERKSEDGRREAGRADKGIVDKGKELLHKLGGKK